MIVRTREAIDPRPLGLMVSPYIYHSHRLAKRRGFDTVSIRHGQGEGRGYRDGEVGGAGRELRAGLQSKVLPKLKQVK